MLKLPSSTVRLITSTQVITSIYSVVKELVENSLDAAADSIDVRLEKGGLDKIEVIDNGTGISTSDINFLCKPHFTSKIKHESDLLDLLSYGFRGEAVHSLCTVADVVVTTKTKDDYVSKVYTFDNLGDVCEEKPTHHNIGTIVSVSKIFKDIPVRRQVYKPKKLKEELCQIEGLLMSYGLSHPKLRITLSNDKNIIWRKNRTSDYVYSYAISEILGKAVCDNLAQLDINEEDFDIKLFIPKAECKTEIVTRSLPDRFFMFVNERPVIIAEIKTILKKSFNNRFPLGTNRWPISIMFLKIKPNLVDVNLEPNKTQVLLLNMEEIVGKVQIVIDSLYSPQKEDGFEDSASNILEPSMNNSDIDQNNEVQTSQIDICNPLANDTHLESTQVMLDNFFDDGISEEHINNHLTKSHNTTTVGRKCFDKEVNPLSDENSFDEEVESNVDGQLLRKSPSEDRNISRKVTETIDMENWSKGNVPDLDISTPVRVLQPQHNVDSIDRRNIHDEDETLELNETTDMEKLSKSKLAFRTPVKITQPSIDQSNKKRKIEDTISYVNGKKIKRKSSVSRPVDGQKKLIETGLFLIEDNNVVEEICDFQLDTIKKRFSCRKSINDKKDIKVVGKLHPHSSTLWLIVISQKLFILNNARLIEKLIYDKMLKNHSLKPEKLSHLILLTQDNLGAENYQHLYKMKDLTVTDGLVKTISHPLFTLNGIMIKISNVSKSGDAIFEWTHCPVNFSNFDLENLVDLIRNISVGGEIYRPKIFLNWFKNEARRLSQESASICFSSELEENMMELKERYKETKLELQLCSHDHPIMLPIKSLKYL